jgi:mannose/fructose/N-acetylgalactosamine-specific phosphotransferase system component IIB
MDRFNNKNLFENQYKDGINLFLGAGFSVNSFSKNGKNLPIGNTLAEELKIYFNLNLDLPLSQLSTILENTKREEFYSYLKTRYTIGDFDKKYLNIDRLNPKSIYTTNIDNLIHEIYKKIPDKYINDVTYNGLSYNDASAIDFSALHGNVLYEDRKMVFDTASISNAYSTNPKIWNQLSIDFERRITLFWGYGLNDTGVIQALTSANTNPLNHKDKWIIVRSIDSDIIHYYEALGFHIIVADTEEFLEYVSSLNKEYKQNKERISQDIEYFLKNNLVPKNNKGLPVRPILEFFTGNPPVWYDIFSNQIYKTSHYNVIRNLVYDSKNLVIQGAPVSGKSTLMMQIAVDIDYDIKLIFENMQLSKAHLITKILENKKAIIFLDNFSDSLEAFNHLAKFSNIKLVGIERTHNFSAISHLIEINKFNIYNVTELKDSDLQGIYDNLPLGTKTSKLNKEKNKDYEKDTIFEFIKKNVKNNTIKDRFIEVLDNLKKHDYKITEFLVLTAYAHRSRIPISLDMLYSYFSDDLTNYQEIYELRDQLDDLVKDYSGGLDLEDDQDYYYPRSFHIAETIIEIIDFDVLKNVMIKALNNIPNIRIPFYNTYRKYAYDKTLVIKAFKEWTDGRNFYEKVYDMDFNNPYVLQQGALYLAYKRKFNLAFEWIDKAITQTNNKYFSIRNSHAIILFEANINNPNDNLDIRRQLDNSMEILEKCFNADKRKVFHAVRYAEQSIEYLNRYYDKKALSYVETAKLWLRSEYQQRNWDRELQNLLNKIEKIKL